MLLSRQLTHGYPSSAAGSKIGNGDADVIFHPRFRAKRIKLIKTDSFPDLGALFFIHYFLLNLFSFLIK
jgi:hypothetical protein